MAKIVESVPNISEGVNSEIIEDCAEQIRNTAGCTLLQYSSDPSHNRTVITYIGSPEAVLDASVKLAKEAARRIDLTNHKGAHPRMGCVDVIPFIPIKDITMEECIELSKVAGKRISEEAGLPVFLYEASASAPHRQNLANIRKGQFEGMAEKVKHPDWIPDFGGPGIHPKGGVVAVGARPPLIAYNINLGTPDIGIANSIAKIIRQADGGLSNVKAIGVALEGRGLVQVSINMTDFTKTPLYRVTELVKTEAARYGVNVVGTELIGLCPMTALIDTAAYYLMIEDFNSTVQVIENHL